MGRIYATSPAKPRPCRRERWIEYGAEEAGDEDDDRRKGRREWKDKREFGRSRTLQYE